MTAMTTSLHQRLHFDTVHGQVMDQSRRYLLMRADVLMGLFDLLPQAARTQALQALGQSVTQFGVDSVRAYAAQPGADHATLLTTMQDAAASLGWGNWQFKPMPDVLQNVLPDALHLSVQNSPFAAATQQREGCACHAITGMLQGLASVLWPKGAQTSEVSCATQTGGDTCHFKASPS